MRLSITFLYSCFLIATVAAISGNHLVLLKKSQTLEKFMKYDFTFPVAQRFKRFIHKYYKIGNLVGFSGTFSKNALERLSRCPLVAEIADDVEFEAFSLLEQDNAPAHLVKLSQENRERTANRAYYYDEEAQGENVNVYIVDTGIQIENEEFGNRAQLGKDFTMEGGADLNGHGTHVAGIVGSATYGVAKKVDLIAVKTLDKSGHGSLSSIMAAMEFAVNHRKKSGRPGIANLSLGAMANSLLNRVIDSATQTGLVVVVAAGNQNIDACEMLPASASKAITVGAVDDTSSNIAEFSNWGSCVDIFTTGVEIASIDVANARRSLKLSGTSMAAPIVSGLVANLLSSGVRVWEVKDRLLELASTDMINEHSISEKTGLPNLVAYNGCDPSTLTDEDSDTD
ncbi:subtilisin-like protein [Metschnikowia bicuspidata var. bicuspidata NRRL YB-4993]|uniref:Subtilisin-like protein n=1 Tax=Metschnikowia bicuspidata var. bicuspidata NRRL YB-4993 TaxID=869754 RepID=A0A1A0HCK7_9ASCO|nr:subtilisin-like protein [Metschnikowia bicuspidata var. bicuspidata NRRL YB-4993]OBA21716.1 subtilisin-like protein [Metschnikowia bicuspidata var. bicuspidata NRRL YB-4993]